jgi:hypothetical protein
VSRAVLIAVLAACSGERAAPPPPAPVPPPPADAGPTGITTISGFDPSSGMHLDDDSPSTKAPPGKKPARQGPAIGIMLKSTPVGATIFVDGEHFGVAPKYWNGVADGSEHEFVFTLPKYALARYRFVPITSGTLHATLVRAESGETLDAGIRPQIAPAFAPDAALAPDAAVAPPPTVIAPAVDAAPTTPDAGTRSPAGPPP